MMKNDNMKNLIVLVFSIVLSLVAAEMFLVVIDYEYTPLSITVANENDCRGFHAFSDEDFVYDENLFWKPKVSEDCIFNNQGFRGDVIDKDNFDDYKIFVLGDSNTLGPRGPEDTSWPHRLENLLRNGSESVTVVNAGVWGYTSYQGLQRFKEILVYEPDMVMVSFGANDAHLVFTPDNEWSKDFSMVNFSSDFRLGFLLKSFLDKMQTAAKSAESDGLVHRVSPEEYKNNLIEMKKLADENNITLVLLTRPFIGTSHSELWWKVFAPQYNNILIDVADENSIRFIDVYSFFREKEELFADESHFNPEGSETMAELIYEDLKRRIIFT